MDKNDTLENNYHPIPQMEDGEKYPDDPNGKWTEIEHLPQWDDRYYRVFTAKKHGKWVMLKTLKPEFQNDSLMTSMIEKEFDVRYNLAHPHIIMINDFEDVPGIGMSIITDDVYGDSLYHLIKTNRVTEKILKKITSDLVDAMEYIQENHILHHPLQPETIIFTENVQNLKVIDVGFAQLNYLSPKHTSEDITAFGKILAETLDALPKETHDYNRLKKIAEECQKPNSRYRNVQELKMALNNRNSTKALLAVIIFLIIMIGILVWLNISATRNKIVDYRSDSPMENFITNRPVYVCRN
ncbi:MAG: protein kinase [Muribaculaceae bacterium]|nr:protein kinase [Muribaculaceae bacterium]